MFCSLLTKYVHRTSKLLTNVYFPKDMLLRILKKSKLIDSMEWTRREINLKLTVDEKQLIQEVFSSYFSNLTEFAFYYDACDRQSDYFLRELEKFELADDPTFR